MTNNSKGFAHILTLIVTIVLFSVGGWWLWKNGKLNITVEGPTPTPTQTKTIEDIPDEWETYINEEYGFTFKHPSNWYWEINPDTETENNISFFVEGEEADHSYGDHSGNEVFTVTAQIDERTLEEIKNNYYPDATYFEIDNKPAIRTDFNSYLIKPSHNKMIHVATSRPGAENYRNQILYSFEFTD